MDYRCRRRLNQKVKCRRFAVVIRSVQRAKLQGFLATGHLVVTSHVLNPSNIGFPSRPFFFLRIYHLLSVALANGVDSRRIYF